VKYGYANWKRKCPCGGIIFADTENWLTPLCYNCYTRKEMALIEGVLDADRLGDKEMIQKLGTLVEEQRKQIARIKPLLDDINNIKTGKHCTTRNCGCHKKAGEAITRWFLSGTGDMVRAKEPHE